MKFFKRGSIDPTSKIYKQAQQVADAHGLTVEQLKVVVIAAWGQSAGEMYSDRSDHPDTGGICRAFGINMRSIGGYYNTSQQDGLFATEFFKTTTGSGSQGERAGNNAMEILVTDIRTANGMDDNWKPVGVEGQTAEENGRFFEYVHVGKEIVTCTTSNVLGAKLVAMSDPNKSVLIIMKNSETGEEKVVQVVIGSEFADATNMNNWQQHLMMGTSREVGLIPQDVAINLETGGTQSVEGVSVTETGAGHQITLPSSAVLAEVNPEISTFFVNPAALPEGVQVVTQDGTNTTLLVSPEALQTITDGGNSNLDFPVQGFSPDDDNLCTASTVMRLTLEGLEVVDPPEANDETFQVTIRAAENSTSVSVADSVTFNDPRATDIQIVGELPDFVKLENGFLVFDNAIILDEQNPQPQFVFDYRTIDADGNLSPETATATITFKNDMGFTVDVEEIETKKEEIKLYPVPCRDHITVEGIDNPNRKEILCIIYNMYGQKVHSKSTHDSGTFNILTSNIPAGTYLLQIRQEGKLLVAKRFVKR